MGRNVLVMGVSGAGKSAVGQALAGRLGRGFLDADDLHSPEAVAKMARGEPLTDADRTPWLRVLADRLSAWRQARAWGVLACSALKRDHRARLRDGDPDLALVFLNPTGLVLAERLRQRTNHFMPASLLGSQLSILEPPQIDEGPLVLDEPSVAQAADKAAAWLAAQPPRPDGNCLMKPVILMIEPLAKAEPELEAHYDVHRLFSADPPDALLNEIGPRVRGVVTGGGAGVHNAILDRLPGLEIIAINGVGLDAVDLQICRERGIRVTTTPDVLIADVAEMAIGLMFAVVRGLCTADRFVRAGDWEAGKPRALAGRLQGRRVGVFGLGGIGRAIAERAAVLGMPVAYCGRRPHEDAPYPFVADLAALARQSDVLVIAASAGPETRGVVDAKVLEALGSEGVLINVSRGSLVDEAALVEAISSGRLGGAGLDVFVDEPIVPEALKRSDRVVLQPHNGSATHEAREAMARLVLDNLAAHFQGREPPTAVC